MISAHPAGDGRRKKGFSQYYQGEENTKETIGLLNSIGFSPIYFLFLK